MKSLLLIILLASVLSSQAQVPQTIPADYDSLKAKILKIDKAINTLHVNVTKFERQTKAGIGLTVLGGILTTIYFVDERNGDGKDKRNIVGLLYGGSGLIVVGTVLQIDAFKFLKRGARRT